MSRKLIVDANVAKSCTDPARHETSLGCLLLTQKLADRRCALLVVLTPQLEDEWERHGTRTFKSWWASMESRRKISHEFDVRVADYRAAIAAINDAGVRDLLIKDVHLVELALLQHYPVASQDESQARHVAAVSLDYPLVGQVEWFNPVTSEGWVEWLESGCEDRRLFAIASRT